MVRFEGPVILGIARFPGGTLVSLHDRDPKKEMEALVRENGAWSLRPVVAPAGDWLWPRVFSTDAGVVWAATAGQAAVVEITPEAVTVRPVAQWKWRAPRQRRGQPWVYWTACARIPGSNDFLEGVAVRKRVQLARVGEATGHVPITKVRLPHDALEVGSMRVHEGEDGPRLCLAVYRRVNHYVRPDRRQDGRVWASCVELPEGALAPDP